MDIVIVNTSEQPIYQQIVEQISRQILNGKLERGSCLPSIRTVAKELEISVITVKKAWEELEHKGFIYTMVGKGCFISDLEKEDLEQKKDRIIEDKLKKDLEYYKNLGITKGEMIELVQKFY